MSDLRIGIIGAGIVGLNTALEVRRVLPDADVTILAELFNDETTSDGAAGLVEISTSFRGPSLDITRCVQFNCVLPKNHYQDVYESSDLHYKYVSASLSTIT